MNVENQWRTENCPEYGYLYCEMPFVCVECEGAWTCNDIETVTLDVIAYYDTNVDGTINPEDAIEDEHYSILIEYCDFNNDGSLDACEIHACVVICENTWRDEVCPDYGYVYCDCPFVVITCDGAWDCEDIKYYSDEVIAYYDTNVDGAINPEDDID
jgi:hypothetical protein